jgi:hypothetical protein
MTTDVSLYLDVHVSCMYLEYNGDTNDTPRDTCQIHARYMHDTYMYYLLGPCRAAASTFAHLRRRQHRGRRRAHLSSQAAAASPSIHAPHIGYRITLYIRYSFGVRSPLSAQLLPVCWAWHTNPLPTLLSSLHLSHGTVLSPLSGLYPSFLHGMLHPRAHPGLYSSSSLGVLGI